MNTDIINLTLPNSAAIQCGVSKIGRGYFMDYYYHYVPGRIRIQTPFIHGNPQNAATFDNAIKTLQGITSVETDAVTGSALIHFDENKIKNEQIISFLEKRGYFIMSKAKTSDEVKARSMDYYYNYVPGRIRIQTPFIHGNPQNAATFDNTIKSLEGITSVETNVVTGSALIQFDENKIKHEQIISFLEKQGYFIMSKAKTSDEVIEKAAEKVLEVAENIIVDSADGGIGET
jgi:copper chaperone CopZ